MLQTTSAFTRKHWLALLVALVINTLVLTNAILHRPGVGYDASQHLNYIQVLPFRLPTQAETSEYFSAPLAYFIPSLVDKVCIVLKGSNCRLVDGKSAQLINFLLSIGITILFWKIADFLRPGNEFMKISLLSILGILTVYYKTFSQVRGEPYVAFFMAWMLYLLIKLLNNLGNISLKDGVILGIVLGLLILSRQWGFFVFPALILLALLLLIRDVKTGWQMGKALAVSAVVAFMIGGWFYLHLYFTYGTFTAFTTKPQGFAIANQPPSFYRNTYLENWELFTKPIRPNFGNTLWPIFYSDTWGDYWGYFTFINASASNPYTNRAEIGPYLGRVNLVSLFPTFILLAGLGWGALCFARAIFKKKSGPDESLIPAFLFLGVLFSWSGYLWFLISYPFLDNAVNNKAAYMIQIFIMLPILAALLLEKLRSRWPVFYMLTMLALLLVFLHNLPALITRFTPV